MVQCPLRDAKFGVLPSDACQWPCKVGMLGAECRFKNRQRTAIRFKSLVVITFETETKTDVHE